MLHWYSKKQDKYFLLSKKNHWHIKNILLLKQAFIHRSYANKYLKKIDSYERLEFLGDSVLGLAMAEELFLQNTASYEGKLSQLRARIVDVNTLFELACTWDIEKYVILEPSTILDDVQAKKRILSNVVEAIIAVYFLEHGFMKTFRWLQKEMAPFIKDRLNTDHNDDQKRILNEILKDKHFDSYELNKICLEKGSQHKKIFEVILSLKEYQTRGVSRTKKEAEQIAAGLLVRKIVHK